VVAKAVARSSFRGTGKPEVIPAKSMQHRVKTPMLLRSSMATGAAAHQTMFVVVQAEFVQTRQYDASGAVAWDLCVWQVTVVGPAQNQIEAGPVAKSI
jgi:hypothetical protein